MNLDIDKLLMVENNELSEVALNLTSDDMSRLLEYLSVKDDKMRYQAFLLLRERSRMDASVYAYWDLFKTKLESKNSYQRSIGVMLLAENVRWDIEEKLQSTLSEVLNVLQDEKPITVRQCIQSLLLVVQQKPQYSADIAKALLQFDLMQVRESMRKLILVDMLHLLIEMNKNNQTEEISNFIVQALTGEILDNKAIKEIKKML